MGGHVVFHDSRLVSTSIQYGKVQHTYSNSVLPSLVSYNEIYIFSMFSPTYSFTSSFSYQLSYVLFMVLYKFNFLLFKKCRSKGLHFATISLVLTSEGNRSVCLFLIWLCR